MSGYVYILKSLKDGSYYLGSTNNYQNRLGQHNSGKSRATKGKRPWKIVFLETYTTLKEARSIEYKLKKLKSRKILEQIIESKEIRIMRR